MADLVPKDTWVEIRCTVLDPGQRAPQVPDDTQRVPLEMRTKGFLAAPACPGEEVEIVTAAGRRLSGVLNEVNPAYRHSFGAPVPELSTVGREVRAMLHQRGRFE